MKITDLISGGLITNYYCFSRCRHCLYRCSPDWERRYIDRGTVRRNLGKAVSLGCSSLHVGGGEPFLNTAALEMVLRESAEMGVAIEYVETNSAWYTDAGAAAELLGKLKGAGLRALLVSISPFHNERIPLRKVKGVMEACRRCGVGVLPWIEEFLGDMERFDECDTHSLEEYTAKFGRDYVRGIPARYWVHLGGRALETFGAVFPRRRAEEILRRCVGPCGELEDTSHFHIDLFGNYVPGLCAGLAIARDDLGAALSDEEYPFLLELAARGIAGLYALAAERFGFEVQREYLNKCDLCWEIRRFLVMERGVRSKDLQPLGHYGA